MLAIVFCGFMALIVRAVTLTGASGNQTYTDYQTRERVASSGRRSK